MFFCPFSDMLVICPRDEWPILIEMTSKERHILELPNEDQTIISSAVPDSIGSKLVKPTSSLFGTALCFNKKGNIMYIGNGVGRLFQIDVIKKQVRAST
jgi:hypothetical protein